MALLALDQEEGSFGSGSARSGGGTQTPLIPESCPNGQIFDQTTNKCVPASHPTQDDP